MRREECSGTRAQFIPWIQFSSRRNLCQTWGEGTQRIKGQDHRSLWSTLTIQGNTALGVRWCWTPPPRTEKWGRWSDHIKLEGTVRAYSRAERSRRPGGESDVRQSRESRRKKWCTRRDGQEERVSIWHMGDDPWVASEEACSSYKSARRVSILLLSSPSIR